MRTTLDLDDALMREAKKRAADDGATLTRVIEEAIRFYLRPQPTTLKPFKLKLLTKKGRAMPGVHWDDRDSLYERMEGRS